VAEKLSDGGLQVALTYTADILGNATGGMNRKVRYFHNIGLDFLLDLHKLASIPGAHFHFAVSQRTGKSLSDEDIGNVFNVAEVCCGPQTQVVTAAWEQELFDNRLGIRAGHLSMGDDFATSSLYWQYVTSGINGNPGSLVFNVPFTEYPDATIGARIRGKPIEHLSLQLGVYNDDLEEDSSHGRNFAVNFADGLMILAEATYHDKLGGVGRALPGHLTLGGYYHSGSFKKLDAPSGSNLPSELESRHYGIYGAADPMVCGADVKPRIRAARAAVGRRRRRAERRHQHLPLLLQHQASSCAVRSPLLPTTASSSASSTAASQRPPRGQRAAGGRRPALSRWCSSSPTHSPDHPWLQLEPSIQYVIEPGGTGDTSPTPSSSARKSRSISVPAWPPSPAPREELVVEAAL
jgi:porin